MPSALGMCLSLAASVQQIVAKIDLRLVTSLGQGIKDKNKHICLLDHKCYVILELLELNREQMNSLRKGHGLWRPLKLAMSLNTSTLLQKTDIFPAQTEVAVENQNRLLPRKAEPDDL